MKYPYTLSSLNEQKFIEVMYDCRYVLSSFGFVYRKSDRYRLVRYVDSQGYLATDIAGVHRRTHRILAEHFIPNPENKRTVNHLDGDKTNCCLFNLAWSTDSENNQHAYDTGLKYGAFKGKHSPVSIPVMVKNFNGDTVGVYPSMLNASKILGIDPVVIRKCKINNRPHIKTNFTFHDC
jgi:hypothetical protein